MRREPELLDAELRAIHCPYSCEDLRAAIWLEGHQCGTRHGFKAAADALKLEVKGLNA